MAATPNWVETIVLRVNEPPSYSTFTQHLSFLKINFQHITTAHLPNDPTDTEAPPANE
jgi:hypothetical protein